MKIRDNDVFFTVDVPVLRIRPCTRAEAAARTERWNRSRTRKLRRRLEAAAKAEHRAGQPAVASAAGQECGARTAAAVARSRRRLAARVRHV